MASQTHTNPNCRSGPNFPLSACTDTFSNTYHLWGMRLMPTQDTRPLGERKAEGKGGDQHDARVIGITKSCDVGRGTLFTAPLPSL